MNNTTDLIYHIFDGLTLDEVRHIFRSGAIREAARIHASENIHLLPLKNLDQAKLTEIERAVTNRKKKERQEFERNANARIIRSGPPDVGHARISYHEALERYSHLPEPSSLVSK